MSDIKIKQKDEKTIKVFDKSLIIADKFKDNLVSTKEKINEVTANDDSNESYSSNKIKYGSIKSTNEVIDKTNDIGKKSFDKSKDRLKKIKFKNKEKKISNKINNTKKVTIKTSKEVAKKSAKATKDTIKASERMIKNTKKIAEATAKATKTTIKATIAAIKASIKALSALIELLIAGGWLSLIVIIIICMIGLICSSIFGIFFSNETKGRSMSSVISEVNGEINNKIENIKKKNQYDEISIDFDYTNWRDVIAIYSVKYNNKKDSDDIAFYLSEPNVTKLKNIFWEMNSIDSIVKVEPSKQYNSKKVKVLHIFMRSNSREDMMYRYNLTAQQKKQVEELLSPEYDDLWQSLIYGSSEGNMQIVNVALQEVGYTHGDKFWKWYGFDSRVEWCAVFVSWCANEIGVLNISIPKFSSTSVGVEWFKERGQWENPGYIPKSGDIIFFDWEQDGKQNHVGIVDHVEGNTIYTVEGNSTDDGVRQQTYNINSKVIFGYGIPLYN